MRPAFTLLNTCLLCLSTGASAAILVDTTPGVGAPPGTLGGYSMTAFPVDPSPEGTLVLQLAPPAAAPVIGNLTFTTEVEHFLAGSVWDTWSHGYTGDVYFNEDHDLLLALPAGTQAFSLYVQPNLKAPFEFRVDSGATVATLAINGNGGASYIGFYSDDPLDPLQFVYVRQTTMDSDGFAVGEFMINAIPEPGLWTLVTGLGLCALAGARRFYPRT
jgi:hypothetical protein